MPTPQVPTAAPPRSRARVDVPPLDPLRYAPTPQRPLRAKWRRLAADTRVQPHSHPWAQVALSSTGVIRMTAGRSTYLVPPTRALWIPPGVEHVVTVVEPADIRTLYIHQTPQRIGPGVPRGERDAWRECRVLEVSPLLRELVTHLPADPDTLAPLESTTGRSRVDSTPSGGLLRSGRYGGSMTDRERWIGALILDELRRAQPLPLGIDLPNDKRLRSLCEAVLDEPTRWPTLDGWAREAGASARTVARLFRSELGTSFLQWRQQVLLARALSMAAKRMPMSAIAVELGYASPSAFTAMVRRSVGAPPSRFFG